MTLYDHGGDEDGACRYCNTVPFDHVDQGDGTHFLRCSCGHVRVEYDEEDPETEREMFDWATGGVK
jgi:hypothetical protein